MKAYISPVSELLDLSAELMQDLNLTIPASGEESMSDTWAD